MTQNERLMIWVNSYGNIYYRPSAKYIWSNNEFISECNKKMF